MVGPHDLTAEMGILGQFRDETFLDAVRTVAKACRAHGTIFGIAGIRDLELLTELVGLGLRFVSAGTDAGFMTEAAGAHARDLRDDPGGGGLARMSTAIHTEQVHDPMAWVGSDFGERRRSRLPAHAGDRRRARGDPRRGCATCRGTTSGASTSAIPTSTVPRARSTTS